MPGSKGEHIDPGWLFRCGGEPERGTPGEPTGPAPARERITHPRFCLARLVQASEVRIFGTAILLTGTTSFALREYRTRPSLPGLGSRPCSRMRARLSYPCRRC